MRHALILLALTLTSFTAISQVKVSEGVVNFDITYPELSSEMKQMEGMLPKSMDMYFKNGMTRSEMSVNGGTTTSITDGKKREIIVLMDMMGKKLALKQDAEDLKKKEAEQKQTGQYPTDIKVNKSGETKVIAGYTCQKATISYKANGQTEQMECFFTPDLPRSMNNLDNPTMQSVEGFMMEYNINQGGMKMRIRANKVTPKAVDAKLFVVPAEYKIVTVEELQEMMGAGE